MKKNNKGFSLVELIIVIAIMAILAGALAPALIKYIAKSRRSTDVSNAQTIATAVTNALSNEAAYDAAVTKKAIYTASVALADLRKNTDSFALAIRDELGTSAYAPKYDKNADFYIQVNSDFKTFTVSVSSTSNEDELYPEVSSNYK